MSLKLCLTCGRERQIVELPSTATVQDLYAAAAQRFAATITALQAGFPPATLEQQSTLAEAGIQNMERITVVVESSNSHDAVAPSPNKKPRRAAAIQASASFAVTIAQQDAMMRSEASTKKRALPNKSPSTATRPRFPAAATEGRRLQDGAVVVPRKKRAATPSSADPSEALLNVLHSKSSEGRLMRQGWRQAVEDAFEQNRAVARVAGISHASYQLLTANQEATDNESLAVHLKVTYPKGVQGRGNFEEEVDYLPRNVLESVIAGIYPANPEALRGSNLALLSPRVFWSLLYHTRVDSSALALQQLQPDLDWSFLRRRREQLSAKARENLRQQQEATNGDVAGDWEAAAAAIESVEQAMGDLAALDRSRRRTQVLAAVEQRQTWRIATPDEWDEDELKACIDQAPIDHVAEVLNQLKAQGIHNWRELANADGAALAEALGLESPSVEAWIDYAQAESVEEIMVEVCGGNVEAVELLRDAANSGTPKDLAAWKSIAGTLRSVLLEKSTDAPSEELLSEWCSHAQAALDQFEWLDLYATPIGP